MNCGGFYISADFLYWRSENHGFSYAYEVETTVPAGLNVGKVLRVHPKWDPGFRVGLGWNTTNDFWDLFLNYTWYKNHKEETRSSTNGFIPLWPVSATQTVTGQFGTVEASTRLLMNMGDLELGRMVYITRTLAIRPHWGARGGALNQRFTDEFNSGIGAVTTNRIFKGKNNYWGVGPRGGLDGEWHLNQGFSLLGKASAALLYGKTKARSLSETSLLDVVTVERQYTDDFYQLVPNMGLLLGLQWQTCFWCEKMFFKMSASWEANIWWDQFNLPYALDSFVAPVVTVGNQPLTMEGLTVNFEWDF